jgi:EAL domain-containing protein (putative c-di-GMP-specific phosphodiesterase class I)
MYRAKRAGGNRVEPFRPAFRDFGADRLQLESDLRRAIERKELSMVYQPIARLEDVEIAGFEALMRWEHPKRGNIPPSEFIPIAEASDIIGPLGLFALEQATSDLMAWQNQTGELPIFVSINLSSVQLLNNELYDDVRSVLSKTHCEPSRLKLELTESMVMENPEQARLVLQKLKEAGLGLALDDFGTGYSSLAYLTRFPFDTIKLDKALVRDDSDKKATILRSVITMARELGMQVVAEGIESNEDAIELAKMGCSYGQSYLFGPPMGSDSVLRLLKERFPLTKRA